MKQALWVMSVVMVGMLGVIGCASRPTGPMQVPLAYRPTDPLSIGAANGIMTKSATVVVLDQRDRKDQVGENVEKETIVQIFSPSDPKDFVRDAVSRNLSAAGVKVGPSGERTVQLTLTRFWVQESTTYTGSVAATVRVLPAGGGQPLWEGQVTGSNERFGRSLNVANYQECFSDCLVQLCNHLMADEGFRNAMK